MSLILEGTYGVETAFITFETPAESDECMIHVGKLIWDQISKGQLVGQLSLSISADVASTESNFLPSISVWGVLDEKITDVAVPRRWIEQYKHIFREQKMLFITPVDHVPLTEVVLTTLSDGGLPRTRASDLISTKLFDDHAILRQGDVILAGGREGSISQGLGIHCRLDMVEPVLQGFVDKTKTKVVLIPGLPSSPKANGVLTDKTNGSVKDDISDGVEIDENFLASALLSANDSLPPPKNELPRIDVISNGMNHLNLSASSGIELRTKTLRRPVQTSGDDHTIYLRTVDLGRVGVQNGDWAIVKTKGGTDRRIARVFADDSLVKQSGMIEACPTLLHNISLKSQQQQCFQTVIIQPSAFGSLDPTLQIARSITVARIASPFSSNKIYQSLFLNALKEYFDPNDRRPARRLVKEGDVIAISISTDNTKKFPGGEVEGNELAGFEPCDSQVNQNEVIYFVVTGVEHDHHNRNLADGTIADLGFWVDPKVTRVAQTGVQNARVPDLGIYLTPASSSPAVLLSRLDRLICPVLLSPSSPFGTMLALSNAALLPEARNYDLHLSLVLKGPRGCGKYTTANWVAQRLGMHLLEINCYDALDDTEAKTEGVFRARFEKAVACAPCVFVLRCLDALTGSTQSSGDGKEPAITSVLRECIGSLRSSWRENNFPVLVVATTSEPSRVPTNILALFKHEISFEAPGEPERNEILSCLTADLVLAPDVSLPTMATQTAALVAADIVDLVIRAKFASIKRVSRASSNVDHHSLIRAVIPLTAADFDEALGKARSSYSASIGAPNIPNVSWNDVGGLAHVKAEILDTIQLPLDRPELFADGLKKRSGILLYGPPGTGKTLLAKAVATSCSLNFFSVKGPELLNMYIGESEANVRRVFQRARDAKPCVIFFDELDSVAPKRGNHGDSGGVMDRIVSQLLAELDGMSSGKGGSDVFVIGATNRPDLLDPALLRPGRFDRMLYLGVSDTHEAQLNILEALTRKFRLDPALNLMLIAQRCPFNYTGADFYALCSDAMLNAMSRKAEELEEKLVELNKLPGPYVHPHPLTPQYYLAELASKEEMEVLVSKSDFELALKSLVPSVSQQEMEHYRSVQQKFSSGKIDE